jgi:hypothetical protein
VSLAPRQIALKAPTIDLHDHFPAELDPGRHVRPPRSSKGHDKGTEIPSRQSRNIRWRR